VVDERGEKPGFRVRTKWSLFCGSVSIGKVIERMGRDTNVLPHAMPAETHQVVHAVVGLGYAGEDLGYAVLLLGFGDGLEAEVCRAGRVAGDMVL
jgi:hypothetical protein